MPLSVCSEPGCPVLTDKDRCPKHRSVKAKSKQLLGLTGARGSTRRWRVLRARVIKRDGNACTNCGSPDRLEVHHLIAKRDGGTDRMENLLTLCYLCHVELEQAKVKILGKQGPELVRGVGADVVPLRP